MSRIRQYLAPKRHRVLASIFAVSSLGAIPALAMTVNIPQAAAISCSTTRGNFDTTIPIWQFSPSQVTKASDACHDFNIGGPADDTDSFYGYYYGSGAWHAGAAGWVYYPDDGLYYPLVTNVATGTPLKAQAYFGNDYATEAY